MAADNLDHFLSNILTQETRKRIQLHEEIVNYLQNPNASIKCEDMDRFLDGISSWIVASNFKVSLNGLEVISHLIDRMAQGFQVYIPTFLPLIVDRLADNKEQVRNSAQDLLVKLMTTVSTPQYVFERLTFAFSHKSPKVKEEMLCVVQRILQETGTAKNVGISKLVPHVVKLLEDPNIPIRELAMDTLSVMYQYVGDRLRRDVMKKDVNASKMGALLARFDEVKNSGLLKTDESSRSSSSLATRRSEDELDRTSNSSTGDPGSPRTPNVTGSSPSSSSSSALIKRVQSTPTSAAPRKFSLGNISSPLGIDEESFTKTFGQVPKVSIYSAKDFSDRVTKVKDVLADQNLEWNKRVDALKEIRAWLTCTTYGVKGHPEFMQMLVTFEPLFYATVRDLRSQVVRETCITVAFLSQELGKDFGHFSETILPPLVLLIPNSAKVMACSATVAIKFILQNTHNHKLIPILASNLSSKSNIIRRQCCEFMGFILQNWPPSTVEKQLAVAMDSIKKGMADADAEARLNSRKAFWHFSENFKSQADQLLQSLDPSKQRQLMGEQQGSSSSSLVDLGESGRTSSTNSIALATTPSSSLAGQNRIGRRYSGASTNHERTTPSSGYGRRISKDRPDGGHSDHRHSSDLDLTSLTDKMSKVGIGGNGQSNRSHLALYGTLRKSKAYSSMSSSKQSQASSSLASSSLVSSSLASSSLATSCDEQTLLTSLKIARPRKSQSGKVLSNLPTPTSSGYSSSINSSMIDRGRSRSKVGVSQSQPSSRSSSPAPRLSYITQIQPDVVPQPTLGFGSRRRSTTGLNKSREGSRDSSPNRSFALGRERRPSGQAKTRSRNLAMQRSTPGEEFVSSRTKAGANSTCDSDDVNSETSSVCSDGSSYWNCGRQVTEDTSEIIACLSSGSWSDRRDGLLALQHLLNNNRTLSRSELKKVTDIFSRMFHDPHGKVFSVFMETLSQLILVHHGDMHDWLYVLMTRLLAKTGADLLGSTQAKIQRTLDTVRSSFPTNQQYMLLSKLLIDQTQSPNLKVKVAMLCYLHGLTQLMSPSDFANTSDVRLAISRIITWTTEPKSVDVRKAAQAALLSLHALNQPEFELIMSVLPKTFQEGAERILQNRSHHSGQSSEAQSLKDPSSPVSNNGGGPCSGLGFKPAQIVSSPAPTQGVTSDEIYDSIRQTSEDIHALVRQGSNFKRSELPIKSVSLASTRGALPGGLTVESRIPSFLQNLPDVDIVAKMAVGRGRKDSCNGAMQSWFGVSNVIKKEREEAEKIAGDSQALLSVPVILQELSHHNERSEERKSCLLQLMKKSREESTGTWDEYFNTVLLILLETLADSDGNIRALSLRVLSEFLRCHPERFHEYVELTVVRSLEAHKDSVKEVTRAAEECSNLLSRIISPERSHVVLGPLIESEDFPINLAAVKMMTQIVEEAEAATVQSILSQITPSLLKAYDNNQSSVRKASVICLVAVYMSVGEEIRPYLQDLHGSKVKLLNVYIKRALDQQTASSCGTSKTSSPTSVIEA